LLHLYTILPQETEKFILRFPEVVRHPPEGEGCKIKLLVKEKPG
jgi:hypothetical protein